MSFLDTNPVFASNYAIVTGAGSGIGKAIALELWNNDYSLILISLSPIELENTKAELKSKAGQQAYIYAADLSNDKEVEKLFEELSKLQPKIHVLINSIGIYVKGTSELTTKDMRILFDTNLIAMHNMIHHVLPTMKKIGEGYIINIGSVTGNLALAGIGGYSASKHAVRGFSDSLSKELAADGIKVTCISPSFTNTGFIKDGAKLTRETMIQTSDIAKTVSYLLSLGKSVSIMDIEINNRTVVANKI